MNIRISNAAWLGKITPSIDPDFEQFDVAIHGIRAGAKILVNYQKLDGLSTLAEFIGRWAPSSENDTGTYLANVCRSLNANPDDDYDVLDPACLAALVGAIIHQEQGQQPYTAGVIAQAVSMALE